MKKLLITVFFGWSGAHKFMEKKNIIGIIYLCTFGLFTIGWIVDIILSFKSLKKSSDFQLDKITVVGTNYKKTEIESLMKLNRLFFLSDADVIKNIEINKHLYKFNFKETTATLVPEPTNPYDKNAIMVMVDNVHIGYIPAELCSSVMKVLNNSNPRIEIYGGDYKYHSNNNVYLVENNFSATLIMK